MFLSFFKMFQKHILSIHIGLCLILLVGERGFERRAAKAQLLSTMKNSCLPKLICELTATSQKDKLSDSEKSLLALISETTISTTAEVTSRYHFAAHMGQLIAGIDGTGCHNFYPSCPFPGSQVLNMIKAVRLKPSS